MTKKITLVFVLFLFIEELATIVKKLVDYEEDRNFCICVAVVFF